MDDTNQNAQSNPNQDQGGINIREGAQITTAGDVIGRDKKVAGGHIIEAGSGSTIFVGDKAPPITRPKFNFGKAFARAWEITWGNKLLWLFGFLSGNDLWYNFIFAFVLSAGMFITIQSVGLLPEISNLPEETQGLQQLTFLAICCVTNLLSSFIQRVLSAIGYGGLLTGIGLADSDEKSSFGKLFDAARHRFGGLFIFRLILWIPTIIIFGLIVGSYGICAPIACLFIPVIAAITLGSCAVALDNIGFLDALYKGWELLNQNRGQIVLLGLSTLIISTAINFAVAVPIWIINSLASYAVLTAPYNFGTNLRTSAVVATLVYIPITFVASGILETWMTSVWALAYRHFAGSPLSPSQPPAPDNLQPA